MDITLRKSRKISIKVKTVVAVTSFMVAFSLSWYLLPFSTEGDQSKYISLWAALKSSDFQNLQDFQNLLYLGSMHIGSREPLYLFISKIASSFVSKQFLISFANGLLSYFSALYFLRIKANPCLIILTVTMNYYYLALFLFLERLKFAIIFLLISLLFTGVVPIFFAIASVLTHTQILGFYGLFFFRKLWNSFSEFRVPKMRLKFIAVMIFFLVLGLILTPILLEYIENFEQKFSIYSRSHAAFDALSVLSSVAKIIIFYFLTVLVSKKPARYLKLFFPLVILAIVIGPNRINIFAYMLFIDAAFRLRGGLNVPSLLVSAYFTWAALGFIERTILYGDGYNVGGNGFFTNFFTM